MSDPFADPHDLRSNKSSSSMHALRSRTIDLEFGRERRAIVVEVRSAWQKFEKIASQRGCKQECSASQDGRFQRPYRSELQGGLHRLGACLGGSSQGLRLVSALPGEFSCLCIVLETRVAAQPEDVCVLPSSKESKEQLRNSFKIMDMQLQ
ncbi:hypothetical protein NA57DRAFT_53389 [Rhizodiscina lignyota]|uniref:Uncharacterized protein n=1 Tax=Rhizodiscina lignyota TaxID=1504668 RepID=A0A9P4IGS1_9PEZI|nr:hypothetical protein NA57DRAFT_53389 [Rhizodiscina lignyota]